MSITLKPEQQEFVAEQVALGRFHSEDEVLERALQLLAAAYLDYDSWAEDVRAKVDEAQASSDRGEGVPLDVAMAQLRQKFQQVQESPPANFAKRPTLVDTIAQFRNNMSAEELDPNAEDIWQDVRDRTPAPSEPRW
jgi:putative addiction module CopG family antidote